MNVPRFIRRLFRSPYDGLRHYGVVEEGVLYRCRQPTPADLVELIVRLRLRTVVSFRGSRSGDVPDQWEEDERRVCRAAGVEFVSIPCNHKNPPTGEQVGQFLELMRDRSRHPVLVHCRLGQQRTLLFCALYRVHINRCSPIKAAAEMDEQGFGVKRRRHRKLFEAFEKFSAPGQMLSEEPSAPGQVSSQNSAG